MSRRDVIDEAQRIADHIDYVREIDCVMTFDVNRDSHGPYTVAIDTVELTDERLTLRSVETTEIDHGYSRAVVSVKGLEMGLADFSTLRVELIKPGGLQSGYSLTELHVESV